MNKSEFIGNLTKDPELTETASGIKIARFTIAVNRNYVGSNGERKTDFFSCIAWRGLAETVAKYVKKGNRVYVCGSMETRDYEDSKGIKRTAYELVLSEIEFLTARSSIEDEAASKKLQPVVDDEDIPF